VTGLTATTSPRLVRAPCVGGPLDGKQIDAEPTWHGLYTPTRGGMSNPLRGVGRYRLEHQDGRPVWRWSGGVVVIEQQQQPPQPQPAGPVPPSELVARWLADCCERHPDAMAPIRELHQSWALWRASRGLPPQAIWQFGRLLGLAGLPRVDKKRRGRLVVVRVGVRLRQSP
jgi:hypothetical protein